jgi:sterol desaturase/sphingolipid hydroxylase (fatty acid hydroxylase superfamily)
MTTTVIDTQTPTSTRTAAQTRLHREAIIARRRLYPSTLLYVGYGLTMLWLGLRSSSPLVALAFFSAGAAAWTLLEYFVHRYILHGRFPAGPGPLRWFAHEYFDPLHWEHHARPWDGHHINGTLRDTLPFALLFVAVAALAPLPTAPMFVAGLMQAYITEEWIHQSVHFYHFRNRYFRYIRRHHLYHHSPIGLEVGYGLTSGFWDVIWRTRIPEADRRALYSHRRATLRQLRPPVSPPPAAGAESRPQL